MTPKPIPVKSWDDLIGLLISSGTPETLPYVHVYEEHVEIGIMGRGWIERTTISHEDLKSPRKRYVLTRARDKLAKAVGEQLCLALRQTPPEGTSTS